MLRYYLRARVERFGGINAVCAAARVEPKTLRSWLEGTRQPHYKRFDHVARVMGGSAEDFGVYKHDDFDEIRELMRAMG